VAKDFNLLDRYEWLGEFWSTDESKKFPGVLRYSPQEGITISALVSSEMAHFYREKTLYGYCQQAGFLTLYGCFVKSEGTFSLSTYSPTLYVSYAVTGGQLTDFDSFKSCQFELTGLDDFCYPQGFRLQNKYTSKSICEAETSDAKISIAKVAKGKMIGRGEISSLILLDEEDRQFEDELDKLARELMDKHNIPYINSKSDISHVLVVENKGGLSREGFLKYMFSLKQLFSLFLLKPVCVKNIKFFYVDGGGKSFSCRVLYSFLIPENEIRQLDSFRDYRLMKVNLNSIKDNFQKIFSSWDDIVHDEADIIINTLTTHVQGGYSAVQHAVTLIACIEQWYHKYEERNGLKYDCVINRYGTDSLRKFIFEKAPIQARPGDTIGQLLSNIRGIVLHPNGARSHTIKNGGILSHTSFLNISEALFVLLLRALFTTLGVSQESIDNFGTEQEPVLCTYHDIDV
jgi:hypothetical protein